MLALTAFFACSPLRAYSDPIKATYEVQIWYRTSYIDLVQEPYRPPPFKLTLSFDSGVTRFDDHLPRSVSEEYGAPTFSDIPLDAPTRPPDLPLHEQSYTANAWSLENASLGPNGPYLHDAIATVVTTSPRIDYFFEYFSGVELALRIEGFPVPGPVSTTSFVDFLGRPIIPSDGSPPDLVRGELNFISWASYTPKTGTDPHSYAYYGVAQSVVPEPPSLLLLGSAVSVLVVSSRWRKRPQ